MPDPLALPLRLPGVQAVPKRLADGTLVHYYRHRATGVALGSNKDNTDAQRRFDELQGRIQTAAPVAVAIKPGAQACRDNPALNDPPGTLGWLIGQFCADDDFFADKERAASTRDWYRRHLYAVRAEHGALPFRTIDKVWVDTYKRHVKKTKGKSAANGRISSLRRLYVFAETRGFHKGSNPAQRPELYTLPTRLTLWERDEEAKLLAAVRVRKLGSPFGHGGRKNVNAALADPNRPSTEDHLPLAMAMGLKLGIYTGQRIGDLLAMKGADAKYLDGRLWMYVVQEKRKGAVKVWIPAHRNLQAFIEQHGIPHKGVHFIRSSTGQRYGYDNFVRMWNMWLEVASIEDRTRHDMRRTAVVRLAESGCSNDLIRQITGHSEKDIRVLVNHYLGKQPLLALQAIEMLEAADAKRAAGTFEVPLARRLGRPR